MPVNVNFGILQPVDVGGEFRRGYEDGRRMRAQDAFSQYVQNPDNPETLNALAKYAPQQAYQIKQQQEARTQAARQQQMVGDALTGSSGAGQIAYFDPDLYLKLQGQEREQAKEGMKAIAQVLESVQTPGEFDQIVMQMAQSEPEFAQYRGRFAEKNAILAQAGELIGAMERARPSIGYVPDGATAYAKNNAGESVLQALNGQPQRQSPVNEPPTNPNPSAGVTLATPEQVATITQAYGGNQAKTQAYLKANNIMVAKEVGGQTYYQINGQWFDNPEGR